MNKVIKGLTIATITLLGANYVLKKINKSKQTPKVTSNEEDFSVVNGEKYVILSEVYNDVINGNIGTVLEKTSDKISDFSSITDRKYHTLNFPNQIKAIETEENQTKVRGM